MHTFAVDAGAPYTLQALADAFGSEPAGVKLALLTAAAKLFFSRPPEAQKLLGACIAAGLNDGDQDVHDRALLYYRCAWGCALESPLFACRGTGHMWQDSSGQVGDRSAPVRLVKNLSRAVFLCMCCSRLNAAWLCLVWCCASASAVHASKCRPCGQNQPAACLALLPPSCRLLKLDVNSAQRIIVGDGTMQSLPFFSTELSPEAQDVRLCCLFSCVHIVLQQCEEHPAQHAGVWQLHSLNGPTWCVLASLALQPATAPFMRCCVLPCRPVLPWLSCGRPYLTSSTR